MSRVSADESLVLGLAALEAGRWAAARAEFEVALLEGETAEACFGLAVASWWLGENRASVTRCTRAYSLFRESGELASAVRCAVWLGITYKANFANHAAANGWITRADRLLEPLDPGPLHGWACVARSYRMSDLPVAEELTMGALDLARCRRHRGGIGHGAAVDRPHPGSGRSASRRAGGQRRWPGRVRPGRHRDRRLST